MYYLEAGNYAVMNDEITLIVCENKVFNDLFHILELELHDIVGAIIRTFREFYVMLYIDFESPRMIFEKNKPFADLLTEKLHVYSLFLRIPLSLCKITQRCHD